MRTSSRTSDIQDYGIIGDCRSAALVSSAGSLDWLCWPRFDSPAIFAALLDVEKGGHWSIAPGSPFRVQRAYVENSNVLEMHFECATGRITLTDLIPVASEDHKRRHLTPDHELVRQVTCTEGEVQVEIVFQPRADYGRNSVKIRDLGKLGLRMDVGRGAYFLRGSAPLTVESGRACAVIRMKRGDVLQFSLSYSEQSPCVLPLLGTEIHQRIERSVSWWQAWASRCSYDGSYRAEVVRSALALKLLAYAPSGAVTAAATTSLPELVGGGLNWDYRYCWLRDASLTIRSLLGLGYRDEAQSFVTWLLHATRLTQPKLRVLYTVFGENAPPERELEYLRGFRGSRPVRVGNDARGQLQLDIYGEVIDAAMQLAIQDGPFDRRTAKVLIGLGKHVAQSWDQPDEGIWEPRSGRQNNTHSRLMCWTALDRLLAADEKQLLKDVPRSLFARERERIQQQLLQRAWNERLRSYVAVLDSEQIDATLLRLPWYGFEKADSQRMQQTYRKVFEKLGAGDGLLYRYQRQPREGAFGICGFWGVEYLALGGGSLEQAEESFRQQLKYGNDLGLFAEEIQPESGIALGNVPQAFTHVGLISAALSIEERARGAKHPAQRTGHDVASHSLRLAG